jgi:DNA-binding transcriptional ArsR family regulator
MLKALFHPKAFLSAKRNVKPGLVARTQIIQALENVALNARGICKVTGLSYKIVLHHLRLLEAEKVVTRRGNRPFTWELTGVGQQRLVNLTSR